MSYAKLNGHYDDADVVRFTASADQSAGDVVVVETRVGVVVDDVLDTEDGLMIVGTDVHGVRMPKATGAIDRHEKLYWDEDGNPLGGTAGSGAVTATASGNLYIGRAAAAAESAAEEASVHLTNE